MAENNPTNARKDILDTIEFIGNQIALCSHLQELINVNRIDILNMEDDEDGKKGKELFIQTEQLKKLLKSAVDLRRRAMTELELEVAQDHRFWCSVKHVIASYQYATEVWYAHPNNVMYSKMQQEAYEQMIAVMSLYTGVEMMTCGRCWLDALSEKEKNGG